MVDSGGMAQNTPTWTIRPVRKDDQPLIASLFEGCMLRAHVGADLSSRTTAVRKFIKSQVKNDLQDIEAAYEDRKDRRARFWVAECLPTDRTSQNQHANENTIIGFVGVQQRHVQNLNEFLIGELKHLVVVPEWRRKGVGEYLVNTLVTFWRSQHGDAIVLDTLGDLDTMKPAVNLYSRLDFQPLQSVALGSGDSAFQLDSMVRYLDYESDSTDPAHSQRKLDIRNALVQKLSSKKGPGKSSRLGAHVSTEHDSLKVQPASEQGSVQSLRSVESGSLVQLVHNGFATGKMNFVVEVEVNTLHSTQIQKGSGAKRQPQLVIKVARFASPYRRLCIGQKRTIAWGGKSSRGKYSSFLVEFSGDHHIRLKSIVLKPAAYVAVDAGQFCCASESEANQTLFHVSKIVSRDKVSVCARLL